MNTNALIYLYGFPGVGKNTIARAIGGSSDFIAIQNHLISNAFRHVIAREPRAKYAALEPLVKHHTMKAWLNFLDFIDATLTHRGLIFTSVLYDDPERIEFFDYIRAWAARTGRPFFPVRLECSRAEIMRRAQSANRDAEFKLTDPAILHNILDSHILMTPRTGDFLNLDITTLSAKDAAAAILAYAQS